jgi:hypothetical protein
MVTDWEMLIDSPGLTRVRVRGLEFRPGNRVRLHPIRRAGFLCSALDGKTAVIESIEQDFQNQVYLTVTIDEGRDSEGWREPGHRFFFSAEEVELLTQ